jgi:hypothetical protein
MTEVEKFYSSLLQDVKSEAHAIENGGMYEPVFTQYAIDLLADAGETENACEAYEEKWLGTQKQLKINGYAISDNYETVDLYISLFYDEENIPRVPKADIDQAEKRITNFFRTAFYKDFVNQIEESSPIFQFAYSLAEFSELRENLVRINAVILTNGSYNGEIPANGEIAGQKIFYNIRDINRLYEISASSQSAIELDFVSEKFEVPCLKAPISNDEYEAYVAVVPGIVLSTLYERYGARLLQQNVRSFLQFVGKINKGIRTTITGSPHMFLAYNNGITATADHIELDASGKHIKLISNLQIVNGGQTTASIYHTWKKDKADISNIFVQMKLSVIKKPDEFDRIVSDISRFANTQNKVNEADFSANNPYLVAYEKISRFILTPVTHSNNMQTCWFFERARGQYKNLRLKEGFRESALKKFDQKYPKNQVVTKVELAKYINAFQEIYDGRKLAIGPHIVVRGNEKNYTQFINNNLPEDPKKINNVFFEDSIAKCILFKTAEKRYGVKPDSIGEMRQVVVPYTISLLSQIANNRLDIYKIWKNQQVSPELSDFIYELMKQVNQFILDKSPVSHYIEWAKKEECWEKVKSNSWSLDLSDIEADIIDPRNPPKRNIIEEPEGSTGNATHEEEIIRSIPFALWKKIESWGKDTDLLSINQQSTAFNIAFRVKNNQKISDSDRAKAMAIFEIVCEHNIDLLSEADELSEPAKEEMNKEEQFDADLGITVELIQKMADWDKRRRILKDWQWKVLNEVASGKRQLDSRLAWGCKKSLDILKKQGFTEV